MIGLAPFLLFCCGVLGCLAWLHGFYASSLVTAATALWIAAGSLWRRSCEPQLGDDRGASSPATGADVEIALRRLQSMLDQTPAPLLTVGIDDVPRASNRAARLLFRTDDRIRPQSALQVALERIRPGERTVLKLSVHPSAEQERSYALSIASSVGPDGAVRLAVLTDIEAEIQAAEATALRELLQLLNHEIMNSLTPVTSLAESAHALLVGGCVADVPEAIEALRTILRRAGGLSRFVRGYRMLARLPPPVPRPSSITALLRHVATLFRSRWPQVTLTMALPEADIIARIDPDQLAQALLNLLANAAEAAISGDVDPPWVRIGVRANDADLQVRVTDSGRGVPAGEEEAIFRPFFTLKEHGTGIGLGLARQIARSHGGALVLEPASSGQGAVFLLTL